MAKAVNTMRQVRVVKHWPSKSEAWDGILAPKGENHC